ncbi:hypothetical protein C5B94_07175 [Clavibacter michiganensis]|uniref:AAA family ATPase n=1 Tax=Clavibacter michiganensis TaxID=28447 RepID=UPI000CE74EC6|nr:AAA family ATPase [Clavibacter michiganensis]PPF54710.1 hypothetical protein C5B94_07175 [Clavibacter michiganensis]
MLIWINGTFGVGKTQAADSLRRRLPGSVVADPEQVGFGIHRMQPPALRGDFQDTPWWEPAVTGILLDVLARHPGDVIVPMALVDAGRHARMLGALRDAGHDVRHVTLLASDETVLRRLRTRLEGPDGWAAAQLPRTAALRGPRFADHVPTDGLTHAQVVEAVARVAGVRIGPDRTAPLRRAVERMRVRIARIR